jgi:hypothetical protein
MTAATAVWLFMSPTLLFTPTALRHQESSTTPNPTGTRQRFHSLLFPRVYLEIKSSSPTILYISITPFRHLRIPLPLGSPNCLRLNIIFSPLLSPLPNAIQQRRFSFRTCNSIAPSSLALMVVNAITMACFPGSSALPDKNNWCSKLDLLMDGIDVKHPSVVWRQQVHLSDSILTNTWHSSFSAFTVTFNSVRTATAQSPTFKPL